MKVVILAGGRGTRIAEESHLRPKPMIEVGGHPLLWHIMKIYAAHGMTDFVICLGYRGYMVKEYFANFFLHRSDVTVDVAANRLEVHGHRSEPWRVTLIDTGDATATGGRVLRATPFIQDEAFLLTYGDGVADVDVVASLAFHREQKRMLTMTVVRPPARYGTCVVREGRVEEFEEKPQAEAGLINGGFFVCDPEVLQFIDGDDSSWERDCVPPLVREGQVSAFQHEGFWQPMDTLREKEYLEHLWESGQAPWKIWR